MNAALHTSVCRPKRTLLALSLGAVFSPAIALAQASQNTQATMLETVVVTAQMQADGTADQGYRVENTRGVGLWGERSLQDTPYSITVISDSLIENAVAKDMNQIFKMNPTAQENSSVASDATGNYWVTLRGFSVRNPVINGISSASRVASAPAMHDLERVEVINGATGFLYGGGRVGGAVNYVTKKPTLEDLRTLAVGGYGGESYFAHVDLGGQFNQAKTFGYRFNAVYQDGQNARKEDREQQSLSLVLDWRPTNDFRTDLRYSYNDTTAPGPTIFWTGTEYTGIAKNQSFTPKWLVQEFTSRKFENNIHWNINPIFTLRTHLMVENIDKTGGDARIIWRGNKVRAGSWRGNYSAQEYKRTGGAFYLDSTFDTFGISHRLTTGYSFATDRVKRGSLGSNSVSYRITEDITLDEFRNAPKPAGWGTRLLHGPKIVSSRPQFRNLLIGDDIIFNDQWSVMLGTNYATAITHNYLTNAKYDKSVWTPTLSLSYKPMENLTTYATYIESLENGRVVGNGYLNEGEVLPPYTSKQYELGAKYVFSDRLSINSALFRLEKANAYEEETLPLPTYTYNGLQVHQGFELSVIGKVTPNLSVMAGGTIMDLSIEKTNNAEARGKRPTGVARYMAKIYADYRVASVPGLFVSGGVYYTGKKFNNADNTQIIPAYTVYDLGLRYETRIADHQTTFNLSIQNLTDKVYWSGTMGDPRTIAFTVKSRF